jgi:hypothetical protein
MLPRPERLFFPGGLFPARLRACLAGFCLVSGLACLGWGLLPSGSATAESPSASGQGAEQGQISLKKQLLQATVDSAAFSLAGSLSGLKDPAVRLGVLTGALDALTFDLGAPVYFTAWEETRLVHSPLTPDAANFDFREAKDGHGLNFIQMLSDTSETGGGFLPVLLRRHVFDRKGTSRNTAFGLSVRTAGSISAACANRLLFPAAPLAREEQEARIVYSRLIPGSDWRISAFLAVAEDLPAGPVSAPERSAVVWDGQERRKAPLEDLRLALCLSGFSFLGLTGVLLRPQQGAA